MGKNNLVHSSRILKFILTVLLLLTTGQVVAADLPLATGSALGGFTFDDRPLALPVQRNFQMAMLTASSELGRSCGKMESYGWRMNQSEQGRVNEIFNSTVDRLRGLGYEVQAQNPTSVSRDITIFTADRTDNHLVVMWSAGEIGLVMVMCQSSPPIAPTPTVAATSSPVDIFPQTVVQGNLPPAMDKKHQAAANHFSPVGSWYGSYTCEQGYTGATLEITGLHGENFEGTFRFYPTPKNPEIPSGRYTVSGQYDRDSNRILINPGKWLEHPKDYYNTVMVGSFDPVARTFSAYFQGITGCTSFEAKSSADYYTGMAGKLHKTAKKHVKKKKKKVVKKAVVAVPVETTPSIVSPAPTSADTVPVPSAAPAPTGASATPAPATSEAVPAGSMPAGIQIPAPTPAPAVPVVAPTPVPAAPATTAPTSLAPSNPTPTPPAASPAAPTAVSPPPATAPAATPSVTPAPAPMPAAPPPATAPAPSSAPAPAGSSRPSTSGALQPDPLMKPFKVASSGQYVPPYIPPAQAPSYVTSVPPSVPPAVPANPPQYAPAPYGNVPVVQQTPQPQTAPQPIYLPPTAPEAPPIQQVPSAQIAPQPNYAPSTVEQALPPQYVPDNGRPQGTPP